MRKKNNDKKNVERANTHHLKYWEMREDKKIYKKKKNVASGDFKVICLSELLLSTNEQRKSRMDYWGSAKCLGKRRKWVRKKRETRKRERERSNEYKEKTVHCKRERERAWELSDCVVTALIIIFTTFPSISNGGAREKEKELLVDALYGGVAVGRLAAGPVWVCPGLRRAKLKTQEPTSMRKNEREKERKSPRAVWSALYGCTTCERYEFRGYALKARRMHAFFPSNCYERTRPRYL